MRSDMIKVGVDRAPHRSLLYATGKVKAKDLGKPFIGVCNSYIDIIPGHVHLRTFADVVKEAIIEAGAFHSNLIRLVWMMVLQWAILVCVILYQAVKL